MKKILGLVLVAVFCSVMAGEGICRINLHQLKDGQRDVRKYVRKGNSVCRFVVFETYGNPELRRAYISADDPSQYAEADFLTQGTPLSDALFSIDGSRSNYLAWSEPYSIGSDTLRTDNDGLIYFYANNGSIVSISKLGYHDYTVTLPELSDTSYMEGYSYFYNTFQVWLKSKATAPSTTSTTTTTNTTTSTYPAGEQTTPGPAHMYPYKIRDVKTIPTTSTTTTTTLPMHMKIRPLRF